MNGFFIWLTKVYEWLLNLVGERLRMVVRFDWRNAKNGSLIWLGKEWLFGLFERRS